jgi:hypothetical protein
MYIYVSKGALGKGGSWTNLMIIQSCQKSHVVNFSNPLIPFSLAQAFFVECSGGDGCYSPCILDPLSPVPRYYHLVVEGGALGFD